MYPTGLDGDAYLGLKFEIGEIGGSLTAAGTLGRFRMGERDPDCGGEIFGVVQNALILIRHMNE
jgi:hypothetical protein